MESTGLLVRAFAQHFAAAQTRALSRAGGPDGAHGMLLVAISQLGPLPPKALALHSGFEKSWITRVIQALESQGLVSKYANPDDARSVLVAATGKGNERAHALESQLNTHAASFIGALAPADRNVARRILTRLTELAAAEAPDKHHPRRLADRSRARNAGNQGT